MQYWDSYMELKKTNFWLWLGIMFIGHIALWKVGKAIYYKFWPKDVLATAAKSTSTTVASSPSWVSKNKEWIALAILLLAAFYFQDSWLPFANKGMQSIQASRPKTAFPDEFAEPSAFFHKDAYVTSPTSHQLELEVPCRRAGGS